MAEAALEDEVLYRPQAGPQLKLVTCIANEIFYGGARGGGKTFGFLLDWAIWSSRYGANYKGVIFRKSYDELDEVILAAKKIFNPLGAVWKAGARTFRMPNGAELKFRFLNRDDDADKYQGHQYTWIAFDEVTNWASPSAINKLRATLRSAEVPPDALRFLLSGNPGGVGHNWVKRRYIDPAPAYHIIREHDKDLNVDRTRVFIPSLYIDNPALANNDPTYLSRLKDSGPAWLVKAWLEGDWSIVAGGMFDDVIDMTTPHEWKDQKTGEIKIWGYGSRIRRFVVPRSWRVNRSFDWGSARPFSVGWWAESDGTPATLSDGTEAHIPANSIVRVHTWYGYTGEPNVGVKMLAKDVARGIIKIEAQLKEGICKGHTIYPGPADSSIWAAENGVCIADDMAAVGVKWTVADKRPGSRKSGWEKMRLLFANAAPAIPEEAGLYCFENDAEFWRMLPVAPRSSRDIDDVDTDWEDHLADEARYRAQEVKRQIKIQKLKGL